MIDAMVAPGEALKSRRQDRLSKNALDVIAWAFNQNFWLEACEVKIGDDDLEVILGGGENFVKHYGSNSIKYFTHAEDPNWALVSKHDCCGNAERGEKIIAAQGAA